MATVKHFEDLRVWQQARSLSKWYFSIVQLTDLKSDYKLRSQADSSIGSVMDNITEGFERNGKRKFIQFLSIAKGSCGEFGSQLYRLFDREYISQIELEKKKSELIAWSKGINSFINYLNNSEKGGWKFMEPDAEYGDRQL